MSDTVEYGPLACLVGVWKGSDGMDVAPEPDDDEHNPYYETLVFEAAGDVTLLAGGKAVLEDGSTILEVRAVAGDADWASCSHRLCERKRARLNSVTGSPSRLTPSATAKQPCSISTTRSAMNTPITTHCNAND